MHDMLVYEINNGLKSPFMKELHLQKGRERHN
jgi:hypothetical protein